MDVIELDDLCPNCGSESLDLNRICSRCGMFSPETPEGVWCDGKRLVARKTAEFPYRCLKTNEAAESHLRKKLRWHPQWVYVLVISPIIYVIVSLILTKRATFDLPYSQQVRQRIRMATVGTWISLAVGILFICLSFSVVDKLAPELSFAALIGGLLTIILGIAICANIANPITPDRITKTHVWLKGVHADYLALLPEWDGDED